MFSVVFGAPDRRRASFWRRAVRDDRGAAAVEFAIVIVPFMAITGLILETSFQAYTQASLDDAVRRASRSLQIGAAQAADKTVEDFKQDICNLQTLLSCDKLVVDVRPIGAFQNLAAVVADPNALRTGRTRPLSPNQSGNYFCPGLPGSLVLVRANYTVPTIFGYWIPTRVADTYVLSSAHTFRTEPFLNQYVRPASCSVFRST